MRAIRNGCALLISLTVLSCGGGNTLGGSTTPPVTPAANVVAVVVDGGPAGLSALSVNTLYTTVTVCVPGSTTECQTIDHIQVDTGSSGLRLLSQALTLSLPVTATSSGASLVECMVFVDGYSWGPVSSVDLEVSGESAHAVRVQLIGDSRFPNVPSDCASTGSAEDTVAAFGANGIIGIGALAQDCGPACATMALPAAYYSCTQAACQNLAVALASQVPNPVTLFSADKNGAIIVLPSVAADGAASVSGSLIFGIDTESNNQLGTLTVLSLDATSGGYLTTVFNGETLSLSFIDSGSSANYFNDASIEQCTDAGFTGLYCPASTRTFSASLQGQDANGANTGTSIPQSFSVANAEAQAQAEPAFTAIPELGGTVGSPGSFDWGLPLFYGRRIAVAIQGYTTTAGAGPFIAL